MEQMTVAEAAKEWGITERRVLSLCHAGRIGGAERFGRSWAIPAGTKKPIDARRKDESQLDDILSTLNSTLPIERVWAMPNSRTFDIKPIRELIFSELTEGLWIDPFANNNKIATVTNDLNTTYDTDYHMDALDFLKLFEDNSVDGVLYDPPYSPRQVSECYNDVGYNVTWDTTKASFWGNHKREISRIVKPGGKVLTFGWNSGGIGMKHGFQIKRILLVPHGGWHNDTICTVETKVKSADPTPQLSLFDQTKTDTDIESTANDEALISKLDALPQGFWDFKNADTRELTHGLHNYPAVMVYPISRNILKVVKSISPISSLLDPFSGSGTVLVEGIVGGVNTVYGNDLNPLARFMSKVKTTPIVRHHLDDLNNRLKSELERDLARYGDVLNSIDVYIADNLNLDITAKDGWGSNAIDYLCSYLADNSCNLVLPDFKNIGYWYRPRVLLELQIIKNCIKQIDESVERDFALLAFSEITRTTSNRRNGEFKMFRMPSDRVKQFNPDVIKEFLTVLRRNSEKMAAFTDMYKNLKSAPNVTILSENSTSLIGVPDNSIDLMVTSPPYGDSRTTVAYGEFSKLSLQWLDIEETTDELIASMDRSLMGGKKFRNGFEYTLDSETLRSSLNKIKDSDIERAGDVYSFYKDLDDTIAAISKKMKQGAYQFWVVGNRTVKMETLQTDKILVELSRKYGLIHVYSIDRNIPNKVMPALNSPTNETGKKAATMTNEHIVILRKL